MNITYLRSLAAGLSLSIVVALAASYLSEHYGGPAMLFALLVGMAFNHLADSDAMKAGITLASKSILRTGVALLGARITFESIGSLGQSTVLLIISGVVVTIVAGYWIGRSLKMSSTLAIVSASAVAICGASAALAVASVLPQNKHTEHSTTLSVVAVTSLSTLAMMFYPIIVGIAEMNDRSAGIFLGATIHDVAQVVGAGYTISTEAGDTSAIVKLLRVACLFPAVVGIGLIFGRDHRAGQSRPQLVPWFLVAFIALVALGSFGFIPPEPQSLMATASRWCLLIAVSALGVRTSLGELSAVGPLPLLAIVLQTLLLAILVFVVLTQTGL